MNPAQLEFVSTGKAPTQTDRFIQALHEAEGEWVGLPYLADFIGGFAVHSRAADARKMGLNIENKVEYSPITRKRHSFYRLLSP